MKLTIEKLVYGGDGLARIPANSDGRSKVVFVPFALAAEMVEAELTEQKQGFARADLKQLLQASPLRIEPVCPHFGKCGGCHYQHTTYENQLAIKEQILRETLQRTANITWPGEVIVHAKEPFHYRNRARFHRVAGKVSSWGYMQAGSHDVLPVKECPLISPLLQRMLDAMWGFADSPALQTVKESEVFANGDESECVASVTLATPQMEAAAIALEPWFEAVRTKVPELRGAGIFPAKEIGNAQDYSWEDPKLNYCLGEHDYQVSCGSFFQVNRFLLETMVKTVIGDARGESAWDLYSGVGLFTLPLMRRFNKVLAVESSPYTLTDLLMNVRNMKTGEFRVEALSVEAFLGGKKKGLKPDLILLDPPRAGLGEASTKHLAEIGAERITYLSCDPATLARDLRVLTIAGYKVLDIHMLDMFPQTYHIETCVHLAR